MYVFGSGRCGWRGGEWMSELGLGFTNPVGAVLDVCLCCGVWVVYVGSMWGNWTRVGSGGVMSV